MGVPGGRKKTNEEFLDTAGVVRDIVAAHHRPARQLQVGHDETHWRSISGSSTSSQPSPGHCRVRGLSGGQPRRGRLMRWTPVSFAENGSLTSANGLYNSWRVGEKSIQCFPRGLVDSAR